MSCSNCFNGCPEITSDKCVKYTGVDVPLLGIKNGDSLSYIEQTLIGYLTTTLDGTGIIPYINPTIICDLVQANLPICNPITIVDLVETLIKCVCDLQEQITTIYTALNTLNAPYTIPSCLSVSPTAGTHAILQAVITEVCTLDTSLTAVINDILTNYSSNGAELNAQIQAYLNSIAVTTLMCNKMVPFTVVEYYGPLNVFASDGTGLGIWANIYLCNGANGTPDKRGRVGVGCTTTPGLIPMDAAVLPGGDNPTYALWTSIGVNSIILSTPQMPKHTHTASAPAVTNPTHYHFIANINKDTGSDLTSTTFIVQSQLLYSAWNSWSYTLKGDATAPTLGRTSSESANVSVGAPSIADAGSDGSHLNYQPGIACYYIMYIP